MIYKRCSSSLMLLEQIQAAISAIATIESFPRLLLNTTLAMSTQAYSIAKTFVSVAFRYQSLACLMTLVRLFLANELEYWTSCSKPRHFNLRCSARSLSSTPKHHLKELLTEYPREITIVNYISADEEFNKVLTKEVETKHATSTSLSCVQVSRIADFLSSFHYFMNYLYYAIEADWSNTTKLSEYTIHMYSNSACRVSRSL